VELGLADQQHVLVARIVRQRQPEELAASEARRVQEDDRQAKDVRAERTLGVGDRVAVARSNWAISLDVKM
jgi:hypothetical protein